MSLWPAIAPAPIADDIRSVVAEGVPNESSSSVDVRLGETSSNDGGPPAAAAGAGAGEKVEEPNGSAAPPPPKGSEAPPAAATLRRFGRRTARARHSGAP